jgi:uncharacterized protein (TIGR02246 family)
MKTNKIDKITARKIIADYADAWITQDPEKIARLFTPDGVYHEYVLEKPYIGHEAIKRYWNDRIIAEENEIKFVLLNVYIENNTVIAEWEATFLYEGKPTLMREVAIMEIVKGKIKSLREYWHSKTLL